MNPRDFCYWLQGFFEITSIVNDSSQAVDISREQSKMIKEHLGKVFNQEVKGIRRTQVQLPENNSPDGKIRFYGNTGLGDSVSISSDGIDNIGNPINPNPIKDINLTPEEVAEAFNVGYVHAISC